MIPFWQFYLCVVGMLAACVLLNLVVYLKDLKVFTVFDHLYSYDEDMEIMLPFLHKDYRRPDLSVSEVLYEVFILSFPVVTGLFCLLGALLVNVLLCVDVVVNSVARFVQTAQEGSLIYEVRRRYREALAWVSSLLRVNHRNRKGE